MSILGCSVLQLDIFLLLKYEISKSVVIDCDTHPGRNNEMVKGWNNETTMVKIRKYETRKYDGEYSI